MRVSATDGNSELQIPADRRRIFISFRSMSVVPIYIQFGNVSGFQNQIASTQFTPQLDLTLSDFGSIVTGPIKLTSAAPAINIGIVESICQ